VLSYVWGGILQPSLKSDNALKSENSLDAFDLPRTIVDAISLCRDIGCQYLWVDSLCIIQDSKDDMHRQIRSMADIYSQSFLAIIAATGDDANAGLPPYGSYGRNPKLSYLVRTSAKGSFVASLSPQIAAEQIGNSTWASRGWTLQEYALSGRVLFFTGSYTFLRCEKALWCEDFGLGFSSRVEGDRIWDLPVPPFYRRALDPRRHYSSTFSRLLTHYIHRKLRYQDDILNAFTGILIRMEDSIGHHIWGLPSKEFGAALQWTTNLPFPTTERAGFPSWSWAGWIHEKGSPSHIETLNDIYEGYDDQETNMSVLTCYAMGDDRNLRAIEECNIDEILSQLQNENGSGRHQRSNKATEIAYLKMELLRHFTAQPSPELQTYLELQHPRKPPLSHHIFLWASCASLYVDRPQKRDGSRGLRMEEGGRQIGSIRLNSEWRETESLDHMDFFVSTVGMPEPASAAPHPERVKMKVILIKLYQNMKPPVYKRIQVSHTDLSLSDWLLASPKSRLIALV
jgi:heterokaryon incompatibility protein (HET)